MDEEQEKDLDLKRVREHADALGGKFDTVQIFVTRYDLTTGNTVSVSVGVGNFQARRGQVREWSVQQDAVSRREALEEPDE